MRDNIWLAKRLEAIWEFLFPEVERKNDVIVKFKGRWKNKFGHIKRLRNNDTEIVVNGLFRNEIVPEYIVDITLAHELVHYTHGFHSPHKQLYRHPHKGGVVNKELIKRGFGHMLKNERYFLKKEWPSIYVKLSNSFPKV